MHRTFFGPRLIGWASLLTLLTFHFGVQSAAAQGQIEPVAFAAQAEIQQTSPTRTIAVGSTDIYTAKNNLKSVTNPNSKVVNIREIKDNPKSVTLEAIGPGRAILSGQSAAASTHHRRHHHANVGGIIRRFMAFGW